MGAILPIGQLQKTVVIVGKAHTLLITLSDLTFSFSFIVLLEVFWEKTKTSPPAESESAAAPDNKEMNMTECEYKASSD